MKKIATLLLCICLGLPIVSALGSCGCRHPENKLELKSTTASCTATGVETYTCTACNNYETTKEVAAYGHRYYVKVDDDGYLYNLKCKYCDRLHINATVDAPATITGYETNSKDGQLKKLEMTVDKVEFKENGQGKCMILTVTPTYLWERPDHVIMYYTRHNIMVGIQVENQTTHESVKYLYYYTEVNAAVGEPLTLIIGIEGYLSENGIKENADWQYVFNIKLLDNVYTELVPQGELKFVGESDN